MLSNSYTTRIEKRRTSLFDNKTDAKNDFKYFLLSHIEKFFKKSFILDLSQVCISNGLGARALQREALLHRDCKTEIGNAFTQTDAISKQIKIAVPDWR